jgi:hypothetical protein
MAALVQARTVSQNVTEEDTKSKAPMMKFNMAGGADFNWPPIAFCAVLLGFVVAIHLGRTPGRNGATELFHWLLAPRSQTVAAADFGQALVVTANSRDQLTVVTTLSPRGFHPLLASCEAEVQSQIGAYPGTVTLAVVDASLRDYVRIARTLKAILPVDSIIVLKSSRRSEDVGPMLLDRLESLRISADKRYGDASSRAGAADPLVRAGRLVPLRQQQ